MKDKIKALGKSPFFWIVVAIGIIGISILVVSMIQGKDKCPPGTSRGQCGDKCVPTCPSGKYDCSTNKCVCPDGQKMCNGECCPANGCIKGLCCSSDRQCPIGPGGKMQCCSNGQICDLNSKTCVSTCAVNNGKECKSGESCLTVGPINQDLQEKFKKDFPQNKYPSALCVNDICSVCVPESTCQFDQDQSSPAALKEEEEEEAISNYYPCTNIINGIDENGVVGYCSSDNTPSDARNCNKNTTKSACTGNCVWRDIFDKDVTNEVINGDIANIGSSDPTKIAYEGNWCGNPGQFLHVHKMNQSKGSGECDVTTCWDVLNKHKNVIDIHWDDEGKVCTSVASCDTGTPVGFSSPCNDDAKPSICNDGYTCATTGEITKSIPDACTPYTTCNAVISSGNADIGWCINETAPGVYDQSCALSETACKEKGPGAIFVNSSYLCPYNTKVVPEVGCSPNNYLSKSGETFSCIFDDPQKKANDLGDVCASGAWEYSVRTFVYNRTRWPITMSYVGEKVSCDYGKTCNPSGLTIKPYSFESYDAGASDGSYWSPKCTSYATFNDFSGDNSFSILIDGHTGSEILTVVVSPPTKGSDLAESVNVTYAHWESENSNWSWIVYIIFYPSWEMSPSDATITYPTPD